MALTSESATARKNSLSPLAHHAVRVKRAVLRSRKGEIPLGEPRRHPRARSIAWQDERDDRRSRLGVPCDAAARPTWPLRRRAATLGRFVTRAWTCLHCREGLSPVNPRVLLLSRPSGYADWRAVDGRFPCLGLAWRRWLVGIIVSDSRNARRLSGGWYLPGGVPSGAVRSIASCLSWLSAREARSATAPRGRSGKAPWLLLVRGSSAG